MSDSTPPPPHDEGYSYPISQDDHESRHNVPPPISGVRIDFADVPAGFWSGIDYILRHPEEILESLKRDVGLKALAGRLLIAIITMAALYGAVMGATNLLQGSPLPLQYKLAQIGVTAVKVPLLLLLTLLIVLPPVYVSNAFLGTQLGFRQLLTLMLASTAILSIALASMATVAFFFSLTSKSYHFLKLLHVIFFTYAGLAGVTYLQRCVDQVAMSRGGQRTGKIFTLMMVLYIFVGTQLAWVLRPFVSSPGQPFQIVRPRTGNFYESVMNSAWKVINPDDK